MSKLYRKLWLRFHRPVDRVNWESVAESIGEDFAIPLSFISIVGYIDKDGLPVIAYSAENSQGLPLDLSTQYSMLHHGFDFARRGSL